MVPVAVIDVGSNTVRLLVAAVDDASLVTIDERKAWVQLGADIANNGSISEAKLSEVSAVTAAFARRARRQRCERLEVLVTSPGRQTSNKADLVSRLERESRATARVLDQEEEARLAFVGATADLADGESRVLVVDVGGGSTQLAVGRPGTDPEWFRSFNIGSIRVASSAFRSDPPGKSGVRTAREIVLDHLAGLTLPAFDHAVAVGGSARALRRISDSPTLGEGELRAAGRKLRKSPADYLVKTFALPLERASTLAAGAVILEELQRQVDMPFAVGRSGIREGAVRVLTAQQAAA